ncbi:hypothetical protein ACIBIZ_52105 [Nonomuraea spiralis]|uniref:hypothetical protein n=1 Tax=Nonomuraea spiralis TaxID=46182 RepID=UPI0037B6AB9D
MERIWSNDEPDDHHLRLPGARSVVTGEALITKENLAQVIKLQGILCLYGEAGVGKTFLTRGVLRELAPVSTFWVRFAPTLTRVISARRFMSRWAWPGRCRAVPASSTD